MAKYSENSPAPAVNSSTFRLMPYIPATIVNGISHCKECGTALVYTDGAWGYDIACATCEIRNYVSIGD